MNLFITCAIGLEKALELELKKFPSLSSIQRGKGGCFACSEETNLSLVIELNLALRTANRVLIEIVRISNPTKASLFQTLFEVNWKEYFPTPYTFAIEVPFSQHPDFVNTMFAAQFMKDAICDRLRKDTGARPSIDPKNPQIRFQALLGAKEAVFYFDSSNIPLFKRGYRSEGGGIAPLKETVASALLMLSGFDPEKDVLLDPCAGSGTFVIEALLMSKRVAPGLLRKEFGYKLHPLFTPELELAVKKKLESEILDDSASYPRPYAIEKEASVFRSLQQAIVKSGCMGSIHSIKGDFRAIPPREVKAGEDVVGPTFIAANPPYGVRIQSSPRELQQLYADLGRYMKLIFGKKGGKGALLIPNAPELSRSIGLRYYESIPVFQGGLDCVWQTYTIHAAKDREERREKDSFRYQD